MDSFLSAPCEKLLPSHNLTTDLEIEIFGHYLNFFGGPKTGMKYIADRIIIFLLIEISLICIQLQRGAGTARDINANSNEYQLNHRLLKF